VSPRRGPSAPPHVQASPPLDAVVASTAWASLAPRRQLYEEDIRRLLDAGLRTMRDAGMTKSPTVSSIVAAAGVSRETFYRHFRSKDDLVAAIVQAGADRLLGYLKHQMQKASKPEDQIRRWTEGILAQASNAEVARTTRAVIWHGRHIRAYRPLETTSTHRALAGLLVEPLRTLGSTDPPRDSRTMTEATMGRMESLIWEETPPTQPDVNHLVNYFLAAIRGAADHPKPPQPHAKTRVQVPKTHAPG